MPTEQGRCYLCHRRGATEFHHVFMGCRRQTSDKYGLTVYLCPACHHERVHKDASVCRTLQRDVQRHAMEYYDWSLEDWIEIIGKNYL